MWITQGGVPWDDRQKGARIHSLCSLQPDVDLDGDILYKAASTRCIEIVDEKQLHRTNHHLVPTVFMVGMWYNAEETLELKESPHEFRELLPDFEKCGQFAELSYETTWSKPQCGIEISPKNDKKAPYRPPYSLSPKEVTELKVQLEKALQNESICPSSSRYGFPVLFVPKQDGGLRMCIDYHAISCITKKKRYPLPHIEELVHPLSGLSYFSQINLASGYHQIRICVGDRQNTALSMKYNPY